MSQPTVAKKTYKRPHSFKQRKTQHNQQVHAQQQQQQYYDDLSENSESDVPLDDIDDMLEEGLNVSSACKNGDDNQLPSHEERKKIVLKKREQDYFDMLPEGWIEVTHFSGMPVYLHKMSRVCTLAKPYYLGSGSTRKHEIPVSAIPCLAYRKELDKEKQQQSANNNLESVKHPDKESMNEESTEQQSSVKEMDLDLTVGKDSMNDQTNEDESINSGLIIEEKLNEILGNISPNTSSENKEHTQHSINQINKKPSFIAKVETVKDNKKERSLSYMKVRDYCEKLFEFQEITIRKFKTWADRRNHMQQRKLAQRPSLPEGTKLITCPLPVKEQGPEAQGRNMRKEFVMNPAGKSSVCILHEFVQHAERVQPKYVFQELENANTPYSATVIINSMQYGTGFGSSKKQAKSEAAKATLEILIPDMKEMTQTSSSNGGKKQDVSTNDLSFFDDIKVEDPRVSELCAKAGQHSPYQILVECLRRNCGMGDTDITTNVRLVKHQKNEFTMKVGSNTATVICRNKREGKQHAAQAILQILHPQISNWGSLLRLYGRGSCKTPKEKKEEEQKITELQNTACANKPNYAILNKLREEMLKLKGNDNQPSICEQTTMDQIKKERTEKDHKVHIQSLVDKSIPEEEYLASRKAVAVIADMKWSTYLMRASAAVVVICILTWPMLSHTRMLNNMSSDFSKIMKAWLHNLDDDDLQFQKSMLLRFRKAKNMEIKNVTDDDLNKSRFFH